MLKSLQHLDAVIFLLIELYWLKNRIPVVLVGILLNFLSKCDNVVLVFSVRVGFKMKKTYLLAGTAILLWSTMATVSKLLLGNFDKYQVLCVGALFGSLLLFVVNLFTGRLKKMKHYRPKDYLHMLGSGLLGNFFYYVFYYAGASLLPASQAFIVNYLWPIMSVVFACVLIKEKLTVRKVIAFVMSFLGVVTVAGDDLLRFDLQTLSGMGLCAAGAVCYGAFTVLNKKWNCDAQLGMMMSFGVSFLLSLTLNVLNGTEWSLNSVQLIGLAWNGMCCMAAGSVCWALALADGNTAKVSNLAYITPFLSLVWTFLVLKEPIDPISILGLCIIVVGIFIQLKDKNSTVVKREQL